MMHLEVFLHLTGENEVKISVGYITLLPILLNGRASIPTIQVFCIGHFAEIWIYSIKMYAGRVGAKRWL